MDLCWHIMSLLFNMLYRFAIVFLPRSKRLLIHGCSHHLQWLWGPRRWSLSVSIVSPSICHEMMGVDAMILVFWTLSFKPTFSFSSFIKRLFSSSSLFVIRVVSSAYLRLLIFLPGYWYFDSSLSFIHPSISHDVHCI